MLLIAGCTQPGESPITEIYSEDMPVMFAYGSLAHESAEYQQMVHPRTGATIKRMLVDGDGEWAVVHVHSIGGDYAYRTQDPRMIVQTMLKQGLDVEWGEQGVVHGLRAVSWRRQHGRSSSLLSRHGPKPARACRGRDRHGRSGVRSGPLLPRRCRVDTV